MGLPPDQPLTDAAIVRRRVQIAVLLGLLGFVARRCSPRAARSGWSRRSSRSASGTTRSRRNITCSGSRASGTTPISSRSSSPTSLVFSGALEADRELLDLRIAIGTVAAQLAAGLAEVLPTDCARPRDGSVGRGPHRGRTGSGPGSLPARRRGDRTRRAAAPALGAAAEQSRSRGAHGAAVAPSTTWSACSSSSRIPARPTCRVTRVSSTRTGAARSRRCWGPTD